MDTCNKLSSFIIGEGTLPLRCAQILLDRKHTIYGMISSDVAVHDWAEERGIPHINPRDQEIVAFLRHRPFDYLFTIANFSIFPNPLLPSPPYPPTHFPH